MLKRWYLGCSIIMAALIFSGCAFMDLKKEVAELQTSVGLGGNITSQTPLQSNILVFLIEEQEGQKEIIRIVVHDKPGMYFFLVTPGTYYLAAFEDRNNNLRYDIGELAGHYEKPVTIKPTYPLPTDKLDIVLATDNQLPIDFPKGVDFSKRAMHSNIFVFGKLANLDDDLFSDENAHMGFWKPLSFLKTHGAGVYFLEPYDSKKIPILFVHGASGTPRHFKYISEHIDRSRYQPWFYYYPSGLSLTRASGGLDYFIQMLHEKYKFDQLIVTAHSMGGLVARGFILKNYFENKQEYIKLLVSISTPWGGLETAQKGVESAPAAIPSWYDVSPNSAYIQNIFSQPLKPEIKYYLLFSYHGDCSLFMDNNDGSVTLRSQLDPRAQEDAIRVVGYDEGHVSILSSPKVMERYNQILESVGSSDHSFWPDFGLSNQKTKD